MHSVYHIYYFLRIVMPKSDRLLEKGREEGQQEGLAEGRKEERQRFLELLHQGLSIDEIKQRLGG